MNKLNNKGFSLVELMLAVLIFAFITTLVLNYSVLQEDAFDHKYLNDVVISVVSKEISSLYMMSDWEGLEGIDKYDEDVLISYVDYYITPHNTASLTVEFSYQYINKMFTIERYIND